MAVSRKAMTEGIRTSTFRGTSNKARFDNPSVSRLRETREPAPFTQGSRWVLPHQLESHVGADAHIGPLEKNTILAGR